VISNTLRYHFKNLWKRNEVLVQKIDKQLMGTFGKHSQFQRHTFLKDYHEKRFYHSLYYYLELLLLAVHPLYKLDFPLSVTCIDFSDHSKFMRVTYKFSHFLLAFMFFRIAFALRGILNYSIYTDEHSKRLW
jgi:hypothetical protein